MKEEELKELLTNLTVNQNNMAKKMLGLSNAVIELQEIIKQEKEWDKRWGYW